MLTICIPTYNRAEKIRERLLELLPQIGNEVEVLIIDNGSNVFVENAISDLIENRKNIKVIRNKFNIGMSANIARCIEVCETKWLWLLGDDDAVLPGALNDILNDTTHAGDDVCYIKYSSYCGANKKDEVLNIDHLLTHPQSGFDFTSNMFLISSSVICTEKITALDKVMDTANSMIPHVVLMFQLLIAGGKISLSTKELVKKTGSEISWSVMQLEYNLILVPQFASTVGDKNFKLIKKFFSYIVFKPTSIFFCAHKLSKVRSRQYVYYMYKGIVLHAIMRDFKIIPFILHMVLFNSFLLHLDSLLPIFTRFCGKSVAAKYRKFMTV